MNALPARRFGSVAVAMVTPFNEDGSVDFDSTRALAKSLVDNGCDTVLVHGTTGESPTTHQPEKDDVIRAVKEEVGDRAFILAGAGSNDTAHAVRIGEASQAAGADGLLVVSPYYNRPSQLGLQAHVRAIADNTDLPVMLYDIPGRTGLAFSDETLDVLSGHPRILAMKDATGKPARGVERMARTGMEWYSGDDGLNFAFLAGGASGVISVVGHVAAAKYRQLVEFIDAGDLVGARNLSAELRPLVNAIMGGGQGAVMAKYACYLQGVIKTPTLRLPLVGPTEDEIAALKAVMQDMGLL